MTEEMKMNKTNLTVTMENARLDALTFFIQSKEQTTPQKLLEKMLEELYEKYVPADTREYIDSKLKPAVSKTKPKKATNHTIKATEIKEPHKTP